MGWTLVTNGRWMATAWFAASVTMEPKLKVLLLTRSMAVPFPAGNCNGLAFVVGLPAISH